MEVDFTDQIIKAKEGKTLNKPFRTPKGPKKFSVYVKNEKGNVVKVNFGDPNMEIKRDDPGRRKNFRARHNCDNPGPKTKARYWSCRQWRGGKKVEAELTEAMKPLHDIKISSEPSEWDGETLVEERDLLLTWPALADAEVVNEDCEECQSEAALPTPSNEENHEQFMSRCMADSKINQEFADPKQRYAVCMKQHEGHNFKESESKRGLWDNIRDKKKRMGDKYRPAKPGDKDRPDEKSWKKAQKPKKKK